MMYHRFKAIRSNDTITGSPFLRFYSIWNDGLVGICWSVRNTRHKLVSE